MRPLPRTAFEQFCRKQFIARTVALMILIIIALGVYIVTR